MSRRYVFPALAMAVLAAALLPLAWRGASPTARSSASVSPPSPTVTSTTSAGPHPRWSDRERSLLAEVEAPDAGARPGARLADLLVADAMALPPDERPAARELLRDALAVDPVHVGALRALAGIRLSDEDLDEALTLANACLAVARDDEECKDYRGMALGRAGKLDADDAEECYRQRPSDFTCVAGLAQLRIRQKRVPEARALVAQMRVLQPSNSLALVLEGDGSLVSGDLVAARRSFEAACKLGQEYACLTIQRMRDAAADAGN